VSERQDVTEEGEIYEEKQTRQNAQLVEFARTALLEVTIDVKEEPLKPLHIRAEWHPTREEAIIIPRV